jgi:O-antigen ligase
MKNSEKYAIFSSLICVLTAYAYAHDGIMIWLTHVFLLAGSGFYLWMIFNKTYEKEKEPVFSTKALDLLTMLAISSLTLCLIGKTKSPSDYLWLCSSLSIFLTTKTRIEYLKFPNGKNQMLLGILSSNLGPGLIILYCLWLGMVNALNGQTTNQQIPYYLSLTFIAICLAAISKNQKYKLTMVTTMVMAILAATFHRFIGIEFWSMLPIINYKNFVAIIGLLAFSMLQTLEKSRTTLTLSTLTSICLLINPSLLGRVGILLLWAIVFWLKIPAFLETKGVNWASGRLAKKIHTLIPLLLAALTIITLTPKIEDISLLLGKNDNLNGRLDVWNTSMNWIKESPLLGNGPNFWYERGTIAVHNTGNQGHRPRGFNAILDTSVQSGIIASVLLCLAFLMSLKNTSLTYREKYLLCSGLFLSFLTETHSFMGIPPNLGEGILVTWLGFVWSATLVLPKPEEKTITTA